MKRFFRDNGLSLLLGGMFIAVLVGQSIVGRLEYNSDQTDHGRQTIGYLAYLETSHFLEGTMENWESEFLQMFVYVIATIFLFQRGSSESKDPDETDPVDRDPRSSNDKKDAPWPVRRGGIVLRLYENSLSLAFLLLFAVAFVLHAVGGAGEYNREQQEHGHAERVSTIQYIETSRFWYESLQNWQSEFLAIFSMVTLSIWLRQRGSPESKPVDAAHSDTGNG